MTKFLFYSIVWIFNFSADVFASDENTSTTNLNSRYVGTWQGTWLEGMSSGKAKLEITEFSGQLSFTALPNFGAAPANLRKLAGNAEMLGLGGKHKGSEAKKGDQSHRYFNYTEAWFFYFCCCCSKP